MNLSPIFSLVPDDDGALGRVLAEATDGIEPVAATDDLGVVNRLWPVTDEAVTRRVSQLMAPAPVFIADGHHRYETACTYRDELAAAGPLADDAPANFVLMMFVAMSDAGLVIQPTHRLVGGLGPISLQQATAAIESHFRVTPTPSVEDTWTAMQEADRADVLGIGTVADGRWAVAELSDPSVMAELVPEHSPAWRGLGVSVLHGCLLDHLLLPASPCETPDVQYVHRVDEAKGAVAAGTCDIAVLVQPTSLDDVRTIAAGGERMPSKSTYFYPKLLSGLVFNPLT